MTLWIDHIAIHVVDGEFAPDWDQLIGILDIYLRYGLILQETVDRVLKTFHRIGKGNVVIETGGFMLDPSQEFIAFLKNFKLFEHEFEGEDFISAIRFIVYQFTLNSVWTRTCVLDFTFSTEDNSTLEDEQQFAKMFLEKYGKVIKEIEELIKKPINARSYCHYF
ncbi:MAG: hypothetical protein ACFFCS_25760 [Candidatus Hodarchaeota archaeon]